MSDRIHRIHRKSVAFLFLFKNTYVCCNWHYNLPPMSTSLNQLCRSCRKRRRSNFKRCSLTQDSLTQIRPRYAWMLPCGSRPLSQQGTARTSSMKKANNLRKRKKKNLFFTLVQNHCPVAVLGEHAHVLASFCFFDSDFFNILSLKREKMSVDNFSNLSPVTQHCWQQYVDFHKCVKAKGEDYKGCKKFKAAYLSLCPESWVSRIVRGQTTLTP